MAEYPSGLLSGVTERRTKYSSCVPVDTCHRLGSMRLPLCDKTHKDRRDIDRKTFTSVDTSLGPVDLTFPVSNSQVPGLTLKGRTPDTRDTYSRTTGENYVQNTLTVSTCRAGRSRSCPSRRIIPHYPRRPVHHLEPSSKYPPSVNRSSR